MVLDLCIKLHLERSQHGVFIGQLDISRLNYLFLLRRVRIDFLYCLRRRMLEVEVSLYESAISFTRILANHIRKVTLLTILDLIGGADIVLARKFVAGGRAVLRN